MPPLFTFAKPVNIHFRALWLATQSCYILWLVCKTQWTRAWVITFTAEYWPDNVFWSLAIHWLGIYWNNYSPQCRWIAVYIYLACSRLGKYPALFTDTEVNNCELFARRKRLCSTLFYSVCSQAHKLNCLALCCHRSLPLWEIQTALHSVLCPLLYVSSPLCVLYSMCPLLYVSSPLCVRSSMCPLLYVSSTLCVLYSIYIYILLSR